jgi:phosphoglycerol geranylgeranyltransferase
MSLSDIARRLERVSATASSAGRQLLGLDTNPVSADWSHITKVDPEGEKQLPLCYPLYLSHTSAISVGGSRDVTDENTEETFELLEYAPVPAFHEPSDAGHVTETTREHSEFLAIPEVLNGDSEALVGTLGKGIEYVREDLGPAMIEEKLGLSMDGTIGSRLSNLAAAYMLDDSVFEAYIIMNTDSAAAREANVTEDDLLDPKIAKQRALAAEYHLESEVLYLEYSGTFGGEEATAILEEIDDAVTWPRLWYGGGLDNRENAQAVLDAGADAVIVGDIFHSIASEEADLIEQAREEFDAETDTEPIREWVEETVTLEETSAARYLSTITAVPNPEQRALKYLSTGVEIALALDELEENSETETLPGESAFADVLSDSDATEFADRLAGLATAEEDTVSAQHISPSL